MKKEIAWLDKIKKNEEDSYPLNITNIIYNNMILTSNGGVLPPSWVVYSDINQTGSSMLRGLTFDYAYFDEEGDTV